MAKRGGIGGLGGLGKGGLQGMMKQVQKLQEDQERVMAELDEERVEGTAGGGVVTATASGNGDLVALKIDPDAVDPDDVEMLEDLVVAAVKDALAKAQAVREQKLSALMSGMPKIPGLSL
ncbi:MAG: YbaB/EbfC family nucleoid-associated protein [Armatimonadetes bacterium]|jgi:DNA-binding YbaB/EbfC family protein|nr:YbaB/EbfC family nucleoid-associated protein [Armatimonadota bacterium]